MASKKQNSTQKALKVKVKKRLEKKNVILSNRVKKIFTQNDETLSIVKFDRTESNIFYDIPISTTSGSAISINIVDHPLDQYSSPYLLNLANKKYIERVRPSLDNTAKVHYRDLPGGNFLDKIQVFELLSLENSEILNFIKKAWINLIFFAKKPFYQVDLSPKIPLAKKGFKIKPNSLWQEISIINLFLFVGSKIGNTLWGISQLTSSMYSRTLFTLTRHDEVIDFQVKEIKILPKELILPLKPVKSKLNREKFKFNFNFGKLFNIFSIEQIPIKSLLTFLAIALVITIPVRSYFYFENAKTTKGKVLGQAEAALDNLQSAQAALSEFNLTDAERYLVNANADFVSAQAQLDEIKSFLTVLAETIPLNNTFRSGTNLLDLGEKLTKAGEYLITGLSEFSGDSDFSLSSRIKNFKASNNEALAQLLSAQENLEKININHLPEENRAKFLELEKSLPKFIDSLEKSNAIMEFAINFLGERDLKKYLIIFQNDNELRASGGFMGSLALADFKNGGLDGISMPAGGTYDLRAGLTKLLQSPEPLRLVNPKWEFQDTNWWSDWPTSAENIRYFYNKSEGATIDGVIAINSDWLGSLLDVTGPIEMSDYNKTITSANFEIELQKSVEIEYTDKKQPKKILTELAPKLIDNIFNVTPDNMLGLVSVFSKGLKEKDIQVYLFNETDQKFVADNNWDGRIKDAQKDYLSVVATNIGGGKTDGVINQEIYHKASISADGSIINSVIINRDHFGPIDETFTNMSNRSFIRVYVPLGSELLYAEGFTAPNAKEFRVPDDYLVPDDKLLNERLAITDDKSLTKIYNENNKTVFANWVTVKPGESKEVLLVYKLPFKIDLTKKAIESDGLIGKIKSAFAPQYAYDSYSLLIQKQSGSNDDKFFSKVQYPIGVLPNISYPNKVENSLTESNYSGNLFEDLFYFIGLKN